MVGLKKRHIKKMLKTGAKADGASLADIRTDIEATIDELYQKRTLCGQHEQKLLCRKTCNGRGCTPEI